MEKECPRDFVAAAEDMEQLGMLKPTAAEDNGGQKRKEKKDSENKATKRLKCGLTASDYFEAGRLCKVNHSKLPINSPEELRSVRIAMVSSDVNDQFVGEHVSIYYPSIESVRCHFGDPKWTVFPAFNRKYVMALEFAIEALGEPVTTNDLKHKKKWSFWVSSSDIKREAGVQDPYWTPPPGWKLGDNLSQDEVTARELRKTKEELLKLKQDMRELAAKKGEESLATMTTPRIAEAASVLAETCRSHNDAMATASIGQVLAELQNLDEVANDVDLHTKCCQLLMFKPAREVFVALRDSKEKRMHWLRHAANNPLPFMNM